MQHVQLNLRYTPERRGELIEELFLEKRRAHMNTLAIGERSRDHQVRSAIMSRARTQLFLVYSTTKHSDILRIICDEMKATYEQLTFGMPDLTAVGPTGSSAMSDRVEISRARSGRLS